MRIKDITIESREPVRVCYLADCKLGNLKVLQLLWVCPRGHVQPSASVEEGTELVVTLRYSAHPLEAVRVGSLLEPGSSTPPREFWEALDWGYVEGDRDYQAVIDKIEEDEVASRLVLCSCGRATPHPPIGGAVKPCDGEQPRFFKMAAESIQAELREREG